MRGVKHPGDEIRRVPRRRIVNRVPLLRKPRRLVGGGWCTPADAVYRYDVGDDCTGWMGRVADAINNVGPYDRFPMPDPIDRRPWWRRVLSWIDDEENGR